MSTLSGKQFGLIKRTSKKAAAFVKKPSIFGDDSDEEHAHEAVNRSLVQEARKSKVKKQTQIEIQKALEEDPTVYEYDSIYDEMEKNKQEKIVQEKTDKSKKPKYIEGLMKAAKVRNREKEKMMERKIQKEREEEGEVEETDAFVTSAYRKKLEEMKEDEDKERREAEMEAKLDVTKQKDLSGFYRYLYRETAGEAATNQETLKSQEGSQPISVNTERLPYEEKKSIDQESKMNKLQRDSDASNVGQDEEYNNKKMEYYPEQRRKEKHLNQHRDRPDDLYMYRKESNEHRSKGREGTYNENKKKRDNEGSRHSKKRTSSESNESSEKKEDSKYDRNDRKDYYQVKSKVDAKLIHDKERRNDKHQDKTEKEEKNKEKLLSNTLSKYSKRNVGESVMSAKERYLARQLTRVATQKTAPIEEND